MIFGKRIKNLKRRKNKIYIYFTNSDCEQPNMIYEVYSSAEEAEKRKKELKKFGYVYI